jgi:hypothetical protein
VGRSATLTHSHPWFSTQQQHPFKPEAAIVASVNSKTACLAVMVNIDNYWISFFFKDFIEESQRTQ